MDNALPTVEIEIAPDGRSFAIPHERVYSVPEGEPEPISVVGYKITGVCHAERAELLSEVARCSKQWDLVNTPYFRSKKDWPQLLADAEEALVAACKRLAQIPDCSE